MANDHGDSIDEGDGGQEGCRLSSSFQLKGLYWAVGGLSAGVTALIFITIMAIGKADAAQLAASEAKTSAATVATDVSWIKQAVERIEKKMDK